MQHGQVLNRIIQKEYPKEFSEWEYVFDETCWGVAQFEYLTQGRNVLSNNLRFAPWELKTPPTVSDIPPCRLVEKLRDAGHHVCYVQDAFSTAHRGGGDSDTSMRALPAFLKRRGIPVFPSKAFADEMRTFARINELIRSSKKVVVALFGSKITEYLDVLALYKAHDNVEFIAGSLLSLALLKAQNPNLSLGINDNLFFKDIGPGQLKQFKGYYDPDRLHLAKDVLEQTPDRIDIKPLNPRLKLQYEVEGIGPETVKYFGDLVRSAQLLIINGCPFNIRHFDTYGGYFKEFMTIARERNTGLKIYECGGDAITAIEYSGVKIDISSTAGKLGLLAPMIETMEDLSQHAPAVIPLIS
jgi:3-phosphoglycerate kinase